MRGSVRFPASGSSKCRISARSLRAIDMDKTCSESAGTRVLKLELGAALLQLSLVSDDSERRSSHTSRSPLLRTAQAEHKKLTSFPSAHMFCNYGFPNYGFPKNADVHWFGFPTGEGAVKRVCHLLQG